MVSRAEVEQFLRSKLDYGNSWGIDTNDVTWTQTFVVSDRNVRLGRMEVSEY